MSNFAPKVSIFLFPIAIHSSYPIPSINPHLVSQVFSTTHSNTFILSKYIPNTFKEKDMSILLLFIANILMGIIGATIITFLKKTENITLRTSIFIGIFGSICFIRLTNGFDFGILSLSNSDNFNYNLLFLNLFIALLAGAISIFLAKEITAIMKENQ